MKRAPQLDCFHAVQRVMRATNDRAPGRPGFAKAVGEALSERLRADEDAVAATLRERKMPKNGKGKMKADDAAKSAASR